VLHMKQHTQLKQENRVKIFEYMKLGYGAGWIAKTLDRSRSMIYRELRRNSDSIGYLYPSEAQATTNKRKARYEPKINKIRGLKEYVIDKLNEYWSPISIAGRQNQC
jgi:IS30 family transposase